MLAVSGEVVADSYVVVLKSGADVSASTGLAGRHGASLRKTFRAGLKGFSFSGSALAARRIAADPAVAYVQPNMVHRASATQSPATWGLDRIDQRNLPLNNSYTYPNTGRRGARRTSSTPASGSRTASSAGGPAPASTPSTAARPTTATATARTSRAPSAAPRTAWPRASSWSRVRVLDCEGSGTTAQVIAGIDWVTAERPVKPAVANMSLGGGADTALDNAVQGVDRRRRHLRHRGRQRHPGHLAPTPATTRPARVPEAITVGATTAPTPAPSSPTAAPASTSSRPA